MARKSKHMTGRAFSVEVCDAIRHHIAERRVLESKRANAFEDRDAALEEKREIEDHESKEYFEACRRHSDAIAAIETLSAAIKWHRNQIDELAEKADEPQLEFMYDPPAEAPKARQMRLGDSVEADTPSDARPVGRPAGSPGKPRPETPDPSKGDGVDEHLAASVNELAVYPLIVEKLVAAGLTTVGRVVAVLDDPAQDIRTIADLGENHAAHLRKAVREFRAKHRRAAMHAEGADEDPGAAPPAKAGRGVRRSARARA